MFQLARRRALLQASSLLAVTTIPSLGINAAAAALISIGTRLPDGRQSVGAVELQNALNRSTSGELRLPAGRYVLDSKELQKTPIQVPTNVTIRGAGIGETSIEIEGEASCNVFELATSSNSGLSDLTLRGNGLSEGYGNGCAVLCILRAASNKGVKNILIERCAFENFASEFWVWILNQSESQTIDGVAIRGCQFRSNGGNAKAASEIRVPAFCIGVQGSSRGHGDVRAVSIQANNATIPDLKGFVVVWQGAKDIVIDSNVIRDAGAKIPNDRGAYAIALYDNARGYGRRPTLLTVRGNTILSPRSCGIYIVMCGKVVVEGNHIEGQFDDQENTLPKAAIAVNGAEVAQIEQNEISDCYGGIVLYAAVVPASLRAVGNSISRIKGERGFGIKLGTTADGDQVKYGVIRNRISGVEGLPIIVRMAARRSFSELSIRDNQIAMPGGACFVSNPFDSSPRHLPDVELTGNTGCT